MEIYYMNILEFKEKLKDFAAFNLNDIRKIDAGFDLRRLNESYIPHSFEYLSSYFLRCTLAGSWVGEDHLTDSECQEVVFLGLGKAGLQ